MTFVRTLACLFALGALVAARPALAQDWIYEAQPGDTLWNICLDYTAKRGCWLELGKYNQIADPMRIQPGTEIRVPLAWLLELPVVGTVLNVQGEVQYQEQDGNNPIRLVEGEQLVLGSVITTLGGTARIQLGDHSEVFLRPQSVLELNRVRMRAGDGGKTSLLLDRGNVEVSVEPEKKSRFEVHTPSAIAAVRGTRYRVVNASRTATRGEVLEGKVAIQAETSVDVPGGFGLLAQQGVALGEPRKLLDPPVFAKPALNGPLPLLVQWQLDPLATRWQVDLYAESGGLIESRQTRQNNYLIEERPLGCYRVIVRAIDAEDFNGLENALPVCIEPPPPEEPERENFLELVLWVVFALAVLL